MDLDKLEKHLRGRKGENYIYCGLHGLRIIILSKISIKMAMKRQNQFKPRK